MIASYLKRLFRMKRYFMVSYSYGSAIGSASFTHNGGFMIDLSFIKKYIIENNEYIKEGQKVDDFSLVILNIIETNKRDYAEFYS